MKKTTVINITGGSGLGKSTAAAMLFALMKMRGYSVELVQEVAKELLYKGYTLGPHLQPEILRLQSDKERYLYNKVDFVITDSPLILCPIYEQYYGGTSNTLDNALSLQSDDAKHVYIMLKRKPEYHDKAWRNETADQAAIVDNLCYSFIKEHRLPLLANEVADISTIISLL